MIIILVYLGRGEWWWGAVCFFSYHRDRNTDQKNTVLRKGLLVEISNGHKTFPHLIFPSSNLQFNELLNTHLLKPVGAAWGPQRGQGAMGNSWPLPESSKSVHAWARHSGSFRKQAKTDGENILIQILQLRLLQTLLKFHESVSIIFSSHVLLDHKSIQFIPFQDYCVLIKSRVPLIWKLSELHVTHVHLDNTVRSFLCVLVAKN